MSCARALAAGLAAAVLLAGCGSDPQSPPDVGAAGPPGRLVALELPDQGVTVRVPSAWEREEVAPGGPLLAKLTSGRSTIALWRYPRTEPLPRTKADLEATRDSLVAAVLAREPTFSVTSTRVLRGTKRRGVEIIGAGPNQGSERRTRSLHLLGEGGEVVLDQYAPSEQFATVDGDVFRTVAASLRITGPPAA